MEIKTKARLWGGSLGIILPKALVEKARIRENSEVIVHIEKPRPKAGEMFGFLKGKIKKSTQEIKDEMRSGWESDSDREREKRWK